MASLSDQRSKATNELLSSSASHHYRNPRRTKSITSRRDGKLKKTANDDDSILDSDVDESSCNSSCLLEIGSEPDIACTFDDKVKISDSYSTPTLIGICRDDDRDTDSFRLLERVGTSNVVDRLHKGHEQGSNALLAFIAADVHPDGNLTDKKGTVNLVSVLQEANKPDQTKVSSIIEAEGEPERKISLIVSEINDGGATSSSNEAGAENFSPILRVKNNRNCVNVVENVAIFDEKVDSTPVGRYTVIAAAATARLDIKFSPDDKEENCELSEKSGKRESSFYRKADIIVGSSNGNTGNKDFIRDKDYLAYYDESKANNSNVTGGPQSKVERESTAIDDPPPRKSCLTTADLGAPLRVRDTCNWTENENPSKTSIFSALRAIASNLLIYENNELTSLKSDTLVEETIVEEPHFVTQPCFGSMSGLLLPVAPPKTTALYSVGHYHGVKRGPRHISGDNIVTVRHPRANNFVQGGSERELSYHDFSKDYFYKRWSLAGAGPELALMRVKLEQVQRELDELRSKHERKLNDYQALLKQLDMAHETRVNLENDLQVACAEISRLKFDNDHLSQQTIDIQVQMQRVQRERDEIIAGQSTANDLAQKLMIEYEELRMDRDNYRRRCHELENNCANLQQSLAMSRDEERIIRLQYENRLETQRQKMDDTLERTQNSSYQQFQKLAQERDMFRANLDVLHQEFEDSLANNSRLQLNLQQRDDELQALKSKHKSLSAEYNRIMEERNKVLEENERLSDETGRQALLEHNRKLEIQVKYLQEREEYYRKMGVASQQPNSDQQGSLYVDIKRFNRNFDDIPL
uniref:Uncharacterized protein n=1 Tax=Romanomermis culicivorax TaxID=13658 RepID=A0A915I974_ROMCU